MKLKSVFVAAGYALFISLIGAVAIGASIPSLLEKAAPYACPEGSEPAIHTEDWQRHGGESGTEVSVLCETPVAEWSRIVTSGAILAGAFFVPIFLLSLLWAFTHPAFVLEDDQHLYFGGISLLLLIGGVGYEHITYPTDNPDLMFIGDNLSEAIHELEKDVGEPLLTDSVHIRFDRINMARLFASDPKAAEDIAFDDGSVQRNNKRKTRHSSPSFLVSEVPWKRIPSLVENALDAAELDSGRVDRVVVDRGWRKRQKGKQGVRITVELRGFEYEATVVFDQEGTQISVDKELPSSAH